MMLYKMVLTFESVDEILKCDVQIKATELYIPVVLFVMLSKVVRLTFESVDEIINCGHSNESNWAALSCGAVYYAVQGGSNFWVCAWNPKVRPFKWKLLSSNFLWCCLLCCNKRTGSLQGISATREREKNVFPGPLNWLKQYWNKLKSTNLNVDVEADLNKRDKLASTAFLLSACLCKGRLF